MNIALDLDGTLITCEQKQMICLRHVLSRFGLTTDFNEVWSAKREGMTTAQALQSTGIDSAMANMVSRLWKESVENPFWTSFDRPYSGVRESLFKLAKLGLLPCLITARSRPEWVHHQLQALGLYQYFSNIVIVPPETAAKSKAKALIRTQSDIFIGDSESDFQAAMLAGTEFLAVSSGQRSQAYLTKKGVSVTFNSLKNALQKVVACRP